MFCSSCGNQIMEKAIICTKCGVPTENEQNKKGKIRTGTVVCAYILSFVAPLFGLIAGIYLLVKGSIANGIINSVLSILLCITYASMFMN